MACQEPCCTFEDDEPIDVGRLGRERHPHWIMLPDPDVPVTSEPLGSEWQDIGHLTEDGIAMAAGFKRPELDLRPYLDAMRADVAAVVKLMFPPRPTPPEERWMQNVKGPHWTP